MDQPVDENYATGYLTVAGPGNGQILWERTGTVASGSPTSAPGPGDAEATATGWFMRRTTGNAANGALIRVDEFRSEPAPRTVYVDANRDIQVDLFWACSGNTPRVDAELIVGDRFFAGGLGQSGFNRVTPATKAPNGYTQAKLMLHPETGQLAQGDSMILRLVWHTTPPCGYSFAHRSATELTASAVRIPLVPDYELPFRVARDGETSEPAEVEPGASASSSPGFPGWAAGGLGLAPLGATRARRSRAALVVIVSLVAAGCLSGPGGSPDSTDGANRSRPAGTAEFTIEGTSSSGDAANGTISGSVANPTGQVIEGAHVSVLDTALFTDTTKAGRFVFQRVPAGTYQYRVEAKEYKVFQGELVVEAGNVTRVSVTLEFLDGRTGDAAAHRHDLWTPDTQKLLLETDIPAPSCSTGMLWTATDFCAYPLDLANHPDKPRVLPGARGLEVEIEWGDQVHNVERAGVAFLDVAYRGAFMYPKGPGESTFIQTSWEMTDNGHALFSSWRLFIYVPTNRAGNLDQTGLQTAAGTFHVKVTQHKGVVPLEPGHHDWWGANDTLTVLGPKVTTAYCYLNAQCAWPQALPAPSSVIPADTVWLEVLLRQEVAREPHPAWGILYRPADVPPAASSDFSDYKAMGAPTQDGLRYVFRQALAPGEADAVYATNPNMRFAITDRQACGPAGCTYASADASSGNGWSLNVTVVAHRTPMPPA